MKPKIAVTRPIPRQWIKPLLSDKYTVIMNKENRVLTQSELESLVKGANVILSLLTDQINEGVMKAAGQQLVLIANYAVGYDNIDIQSATNREIAVTNTPDASTQAVAEHTMALILAAAKKIVEADGFVRAGKYKFWEPQLLMGQELGGKTLGIVGCGRIGNLVAINCYHGLGMKIVYHDINKNYELERATHAYQVSLSRLLEISDIVSLHVPLLPSTHHMISTPEFARMKETAILINTARGPIVDERALIKALKNKKLFAAGLDVFENESKVSPTLKKLYNVILTPHIASSTLPARKKMGEMVVKNIEAVLDNKLPPGLVNTELKSNFEEEI